MPERRTPAAKDEPSRRGKPRPGPPGRAAAPRWPSVDDQVRAAGAAPGSALERLIRENQEVEMLRAEEASDGLPLPAWLRIHWRKQHPGGDYSGRSGGYPLTLGHLHQWMLANPELPGYPAAGGHRTAREA